MNNGEGMETDSGSVSQGSNPSPAAPTNFYEGASWPSPFTSRRFAAILLYPGVTRVIVLYRLRASGPQKKGLEQIRCRTQVRLCDNATASVKDSTSTKHGVDKRVFIKFRARV